MGRLFLLLWLMERTTPTSLYIKNHFLFGSNVGNNGRVNIRVNVIIIIMLISVDWVVLSGWLKSVQIVFLRYTISR